MRSCDVLRVTYKHILAYVSDFYTVATIHTLGTLAPNRITLMRFWFLMTPVIELIHATRQYRTLRVCVGSLFNKIPTSFKRRCAVEVWATGRSGQRASSRKHKQAVLMAIRACSLAPAGRLEASACPLLAPASASLPARARA